MTVNVNPTPVSGDFIDFVYNFIRPLEGFVPRIYSDGNGVPTLGVGYALLVKVSGVWQLRDNLELKGSASN